MTNLDVAIKPETIALREKWQPRIDAMRNALAADERETHINWMQGEKVFHITTDDPRVFWRLVRRGLEPTSFRGPTAFFDDLKPGSRSVLPKWLLGPGS